jgi:ABC-type branched-subunit amino acid transport system permease subunit
MAGVGGAALGPVTGSATGGTFNFGVSLTLLAVLLIAGRRAVPAVFIAAAAYIVVPGFIDDPTVLQYLPVAFGVAAIVVSTDAIGAARRAFDATPRAAARFQAPSPARARRRIMAAEPSA